MHNIHYLIVEADSHEDAQETALYELQDWGDENNWRVVIGSLSKADGTIAEGEFNRWGTSYLDPKVIEENIKPVFKYTVPTKSAIAAVLSENAEKQSDYHLIKMYFEFLYQKSSSVTDDIWNGAYYSYEYDEIGITNLCGFNDHDDKYIVAIDMHS